MSDFQRQRRLHRQIPMAKYLRPQSCHFLVHENVHFYYFEGKNVQANLTRNCSYLARIPHVHIYHTAILHLKGPFSPRAVFNKDRGFGSVGGLQ